jgi:selenocysteine-specific elongation factor
MPVLAQQINITLGTAGHIDHGKTALVRSLTGCETDRLKEEKERGMSIELGFAPCTIGDSQVGIVDVPGHENFIKTMVAGASGMDAVILVVAADDGIMPQTHEHLEILTLLGIEHGLVALTKIDRVGPDRLDLVRDELKNLLQTTFLAEAPIVPVSNVTLDGLGDLHKALDAMVRHVRPKRTDGVFRLPVERTFSAKGYGTVVCGVPVAGSARVGDEVVLLPQGLTGRIKAIQVYKRPGQIVKAGQCTAINVPHWEHSAIERGNTMAAPGFFVPQEWCACRLRLLPHEGLYLKTGTRVKFHTGTSELLATVYLMESAQMQAGEERLVQVRLASPLVAGPGDRFIVRALSPVRTIGGGVLIETMERRLKRKRPETLGELKAQADVVLDEERLVECCVRRAPRLAAEERELSFRAKVPPERLREMLAALAGKGKVLRLTPALYMHPETAREAGEKLAGVVEAFHRTSPESPGITMEALRASCGYEKAILEGLVALLIKEGNVVERGQRIALAGHKETFKAEDRQLLDAIEAVFRERLFCPPEPDELVTLTHAARPQVDKALKLLREHERIVWVGEGLLFHREAVDRAREKLVATIQQEGKLESVRFKYLLDTTRKYALPLLDYFDRIGLTSRVNNTRYLRRPAGR